MIRLTPLKADEPTVINISKVLQIFPHGQGKNCERAVGLIFAEKHIPNMYFEDDYDSFVSALFGTEPGCAPES